MNLIYLLTSFKGRTNRQPYWIATLGLSLLSMGGALLWLVLLYPTAAVMTKRWHDIGRSGWWSLSMLGIPLSLTMLGFSEAWWWVAMSLVPMLGSLWMFGVLGLRRGMNGPNDYGQDPLGPTALIYNRRKYFRRSDGTFTDLADRPLRDLALLAGLRSAYRATHLPE